MRIANRINKLNGNLIDWLLESNPWTKYKPLIDLVNGAND
jgi:hypothetical protein